MTSSFEASSSAVSLPPPPPPLLSPSKIHALELFLQSSWCISVCFIPVCTHLTVYVCDALTFSCIVGGVVLGMLRSYTWVPL